MFDSKSLFHKNTVKYLILFLTILFYFFLTFGRNSLEISDEDVYFHSGLVFHLPFKTFGNLLYPSVFFIISKFLSDPIEIVSTTYFVLSSTMFLVLIAFLKRFTKSFWLSYFVSICFLFSNFQINLSPRITILNLIFGLAFLTILDKYKDNYSKWGITTIGLLLCNYVSRPEFFWFFVVSAFVFVFFVLKDKIIKPANKVLFLFLLSIVIGFFYFIGGGINEPGKLKVAFTQHFFDNYETWYGKTFDYDEEFTMFSKIFGIVNSDLDLITSNPPMFFKHVFTNFTHYFVVVFKILKTTFYDNLTFFFGKWTGIFAVIFSVSFCFIIDFKKSIINFKKELIEYAPNLIFLLLFLFPTVISVLVVYPRDHYTILHIPLYFIFIAFGLKSVEYRFGTIKSRANIIIILIILSGIFAKLFNKKADLTNADYYKFMREVSKKEHLNILSNDLFGYNYFKGGNTKLNVWDTQKQDLVGIINSKKYDVLSLNRLDLEIELNRKFVKEGYLKTNFVRIHKFDAIQRILFVRPEIVNLFATKKALRK